ncbi:Flp pilus assembly protein CpaB [Paenibacillus alkalitolerans]|uniref:Flp pilus assembly protein CpaB n=1 Tax=Paenibacillus alkalitolerans TaxID=2799335 RepID=UPI0018F698B1|nr:RcpC/CpaB family pilus assembly protein [Paenibacillus alkalitolerans]
MRKWIVTIVGIAMMAASVYGYSWYANRVEKQIDTTAALMPARLIASGEIIDASMLRKATVPVNALQPGAVTKAADVVGKTAVAPIGPEEQILPWKLADDQITPRDGERYISFKTDDVANVSNMIRRGDRVDVWVEFSEAKEIGGELVGSLKIIEGLRVAGVRTAEGAEVTDTASLDAAFQPTGRQHQRVRGAANGKPDVNTFIMSEEVYEAYTLARIMGTIKLALPDLSLQDTSPARVTPGYELLSKTLPAEGDESK